MKRKIIGIFICALLIATMLPITGTVTAGSEEDPEIVDEKGDTLWKHFDIVSSWFFENADDADFLFISMKVNDLKNYRAGGTYLVEWTSPSGRWATASIIGTRMADEWRCGDYSEGSNNQFQDLPLCDGTIDKPNNIITWKISKDQIGNPEPGDVLTDTRAGSCITGHYLVLLAFRALPRFHDYGPDEGYGLDYTIKY